MMQLILDEHNASFPISLQPKSGESSRLTYARLSIECIQKKRDRSEDELGKKRGCHVSVSLWSARRNPSSRSSEKSFELVNSWERRVASWGRHSKIFSVGDAIDTEEMKKFTYVTLGVSDGREKNVIIVLKLTSETLDQKLLSLRTLPHEAIVLRGPHLALRMSSKLRLLTLNGETITVDNVGQNKMVVHGLCNTERDTHCFVLAEPNDIFETQSIAVLLLTWNGNLEVKRRLTEETPKELTMAASYTIGTLVIGDRKNGSLRIIDVLSDNPDKGYRAEQPQHGLKSVSLHSGKLFLCSGGTIGDIFKVDLYSNGYESIQKLQSSVKPLFRATCETMRTSQHNHVFTQWRDMILQINTDTGTCCTGAPFQDTGDSETATKEILKSPSLQNLGTGLERRIHDGVQSLIAKASDLEDKRNMLTHVRNMLAQSQNQLPVPVQRSGFTKRLSHVIQLKAKGGPRVSMQNDEMDICKIGVNGRRNKTQNAHETDDRRPRIQLRQCHCGVDESNEHICVALQLFVSSDEGDDEAIIARPSFHLNTTRGVPESWDIFQDGDWLPNIPMWFAACVPLPAGAVGESLDDMEVNVTLIFQKEKSQNLGTFPILPSMNRIKELDVNIDNLIETASHRRSVHIIAEGAGVHEMKDNVFSTNTKNVDVAVSEDMVKTSFELASATELAVKIGRLKSSMADSSQLRSTVLFSNEAVEDLNLATYALDEEIKYLGKIGSQKDGFGFSQTEVKDILQNQVLVDEVMGRLEELLLGL